MKDYIEIEKENGLKEKMELVLLCEAPELEGHYIIYRSLDEEPEYYGAKWKGDLKNGSLNTDLSKKEQEYLNKLFAELDLVK